MLKRLVGFLTVMALGIGAAFAQEPPPVTIDTIGETAQGAITANLLKVAGPAFVILALAIGIGLLMKWLKKAARSS